MEITNTEKVIQMIEWIVNSDSDDRMDIVKSDSDDRMDSEDDFE